MKKKTFEKAYENVNNEVQGKYTHSIVLTNMRYETGCEEWQIDKRYSFTYPQNEVEKVNITTGISLHSREEIKAMIDCLLECESENNKESNWFVEYLKTKTNTNKTEDKELKER